MLSALSLTMIFIPKETRGDAHLSRSGVKSSTRSLPL